MKAERELRKYEWHVAFSQQYQAYAVKYFLRNKEKKYTTYTVALYDTKEDAADAYNFMTADHTRVYKYKIDFTTQTWREKLPETVKCQGLRHYHMTKQTKTDFDKLAEIVDRHTFDDPPEQKLVDPEVRAEVDSNLEKVVKYNKNLRFI